MSASSSVGQLHRPSSSPEARSAAGSVVSGVFETDSISSQQRPFSRLEAVLAKEQTTPSCETEKWSGTCEGLLQIDSPPVSHFPLLQDAGMQVLLRHSPELVPMEHLAIILNEVTTLGRIVHYKHKYLGCQGNGVLIVGKKGIGKSSMLQTLALPGVLHDILQQARNSTQLCAPFDKSVRATVVLYYQLKAHSKSASDCFTDWMLQALKGASSGPGHQLFPPGSVQRERLEDGWPRPDPSGIDHVAALQVVSDLLRTLSVRAVCILDDVENLFDDTCFSDEAARCWYDQLYNTDTIRYPALAMVLSASLQRARQLFLLGPNERRTDFNGRYKHAAQYSGNWTGSKFRACFVSTPAWTPFVLGWFLLHRVTTLEPDESDVDVARRLDSALAGSGYPPGALQTRTHSEVLLGVQVQLGMRRLLRLHGDSPRTLGRVAVSGKIWNDPRESGDYSSKSVSSFADPALQVVLELLAEDGVIAQLFNHQGPVEESRLDPAPASSPFLLGFAPNQLRVSVERVSDALKARVHGLAAASPATGWVRHTLNAAIDAGLLQEVRGHGPRGSNSQFMQLSSPTLVWDAYKPQVDPNIVDWFSSPGFGEQRELPVARALARLSATHATVTDRARAFRDVASSTLPVHVLVETEAGVVPQNNDVSTAPLAALRLVLPGKATKADLQTALPGVKTWEEAILKGRDALSAVASDVHLSESMLAAYISVHSMHGSLLPYFGTLNHAFWLKELPDREGSDLVGIIPAKQETGTLQITVIRAQVKTGEQHTLQPGRGGRAAREAVDKAVSRFSGKSAANAEAVDVRAQHEPVVEAIRCVIVGAPAGQRCEDVQPEDHLAQWAQNFHAIHKMTSVKSLVCLATTHSPPLSSIEHLRRCRITLLDAWDLRHSWGPLGEIGRAHGIAPFRDPPPPPMANADLATSAGGAAASFSPDDFREMCLRRAALSRSGEPVGSTDAPKEGL